MAKSHSDTIEAVVDRFMAVVEAALEQDWEPIGYEEGGPEEMMLVAKMYEMMTPQQHDQLNQAVGPLRHAQFVKAMEQRLRKANAIQPNG